MRIIFFISFMFSTSFGFSQASANNWYFGQNAGISFNVVPPAAINNGMLSTQEGCATISNSAGQLLFYTDGISVWNKLHNTMPNGFALNGSISSTQSAVIVPKPGSSNLYYIFTTFEQAYSSFCYNIVDMNLAGGNGNVILKNQVLLDTACEKIAVVGNCDSSQYWVVVHGWNSDSFFAYKVTSAGISTPVISNVGMVIQDLGSGVKLESAGYMKFSTDAKHLALTTNLTKNTLQIFDFDQNTGLLSNPITDSFAYDPSKFYDAIYGCSFSPDNSKLYVTQYSANDSTRLYQYDMNLSNSTAILSSRTVIASRKVNIGKGSFGALQNGPDGKMYCCLYLDTLLSVIDNPNGAGLACNYSDASFSLAGKECRLGLPFVLENYNGTSAGLNINLPSATKICNGDTLFTPQVNQAHFTITPILTVHVSADSSMISFFPTSTTTYTIIATKSCNEKDTLFLTITVIPKPIANFFHTPDSPIVGSTVTLTNTSTNNTYNAWYFQNAMVSNNLNYTFIQNDTGLYCYILKVNNENVCEDTMMDCIYFKAKPLIEPSAIFIPNVFSPNGDGINDFFTIIGKNIKLKDLFIYNRWGENIFQSVDLNISWDGRHRSIPCEIGTYYYYLNYVDSQNVQKFVKGDILLLR